MSFHFRPAVRESIPLILGIVGPSGGGKTMSALRLATGMAGAKRIALIDTEAGRAKHYADMFSFDHGDLEAPFSPDRYAEAIAAADSAGYPVIVVDSASHEHAGDGGLLDMQEEEYQRMGARESAKMASWIRPKRAHKKMVSRLLQLRAHLILCFRAEQRVDMVKGPDGKTHVVPKTTLSGFSEWIPVAEKNILYELTGSMLLTPDAPGHPKPIKLQEQMRSFFPLDQPITEQSGERLAEWARGGATADGVFVRSRIHHDHPPDKDVLIGRVEAGFDKLALPATERAKLAEQFCGVADWRHAEAGDLAKLLAELVRRFRAK